MTHAHSERWGEQSDSGSIGYIPAKRDIRPIISCRECQCLSEATSEHYFECLSLFGTLSEV